MPLSEIPPDELCFTFVRSGGPGGQNVNKVATKAVLRWNVVANRTIPEHVRERFRKRYATRINDDGELVLTSQRHREADRNRRDCLARLGEMLQEARKTPKTRRPTKPSRGAKERRLQSKRQRSEKKSQRRARFD